MFIDMSLIGEKVARIQLIALANSPDFIDWRRIDRSLSARFARQFDTQGAYRSGGWEQLKPSTIAAKRKAGMSEPERILYGTGRLRNSLARPTSADHLFDPETGEGLTFGTKVPYAVFHHSKEPRRRLPRRPLLALTRPDQLALAKMMQQDMAKHVRRR